MPAKTIIKLLSTDEKPIGVVGSPSDSFEVTIDIREISAEDKLLGELVCFLVKEGENNILVLGQVTEIRTENKWHEEPSFKSVIKRHGSLPHLSGVADNRIAKISVQSSFNLGKDEVNDPEAHKLANSPSTGQQAKRITDDIMKLLMKKHTDDLVCIGKAYDTEIRMPFWFKHFGDPAKGGCGEAHHIGVFGRTGSGKTTTAANMILGYARNKEYMSILILDPKGQFYEDSKILPENVKFEDKIKETGMRYERFKIPENIALPNESYLFSELLRSYGFVSKAFRIFTEEKLDLMQSSIDDYFQGRMNNPRFNIGDADSDTLLSEMINCFDTDQNYTANVYSQGQYLNNLRRRIHSIVDGTIPLAASVVTIWKDVCRLFNATGKTSLESIIQKIVAGVGNVVILDIRKNPLQDNSENLQALYIKLIEEKIVNQGAAEYAKGGLNCLIVMDEAHRFISTTSFDERIQQLSTKIIDSVRTTRQYGIGYMFITQTIDSLHEEIRRQIRIAAFGYGLTSGTEFNKIRDIINDDASAKFYRSFIDPSSNNKYPFMFYGPVSPLSFTGSPLFLEMDKALTVFDPKS